MRFSMLRDTSWYSPRMVGLFFLMRVVCYITSYASKEVLTYSSKRTSHRLHSRRPMLRAWRIRSAQINAHKVLLARSL
ncbi:hypothetical protein LINPERHAP1_LOCUS23309 [Linum perenne]